MLVVLVLLTTITFLACAKGSGTYQVGDSVQVEWKGSWWPAKILEVGTGAKAGKYKIHYDNYSDSWDEWVGPERIKK